MDAPLVLTFVTENWTGLSALFGDPYGNTVTEQVT